MVERQSSSMVLYSWNALPVALSKEEDSLFFLSSSSACPSLVNLSYKFSVKEKKLHRFFLTHRGYFSFLLRPILLFSHVFIIYKGMFATSI